MILSFRTDISGQIAKTLIRLLVEELSDQGLHCLIFHLYHFSSPEPSGSQGELIEYPWSGVRRLSASVVVRPHFSNIFSSETTWPIKAKFYVEPPWVGGTKVYINGPGHMTKMAATPIYGKNPSKIFFSRTGRPISTKLGM